MSLDFPFSVLIRNMDVSREVVYFFVSRSKDISPERSQSVFLDISPDFHSSIFIRNMDISRDSVSSILYRSTAIPPETSQSVFLDMTPDYHSSVPLGLADTSRKPVSSIQCCSIDMSWLLLSRSSWTCLRTAHLPSSLDIWTYLMTLSIQSIPDPRKYLSGVNPVTPSVQSKSSHSVLTERI